ncbi:hypothetical protein BDZ89DRAFT_1141775 [Hymenopellis radicata]|nr:hypothetical protein BDZ89DRAFT_1141775 [Hymenopellis radicata]
MSFHGIRDRARLVVVLLGTVFNARRQGRVSPVLPCSTLMSKSGTRRLPSTLSFLPPRPDVFCSERRSDALGDASVVPMISMSVTPNSGYSSVTSGVDSSFKLLYVLLASFHASFLPAEAHSTLDECRLAMSLISTSAGELLDSDSPA